MKKLLWLILILLLSVFLGCQIDDADLEYSQTEEPKIMTIGLEAEQYFRIAETCPVEFVGYDGTQFVVETDTDGADCMLSVLNEGSRADACAWVFVVTNTWPFWNGYYCCVPEGPYYY